MTSLVCPACNHKGTTVLDSRPIGPFSGRILPDPAYLGSGPRRRHQCNDCKFRWTTQEIAVNSLNELYGTPAWQPAIALHIDKENK